MSPPAPLIASTVMMIGSRHSLNSDCSLVGGHACVKQVCLALPGCQDNWEQNQTVLKEVCLSGAGWVESSAGQISSRNRCWWLGNISRSRFLPRPSPRPPPRQDRQTVKVEMTEFFCCRFFVDLLVFGSVTVKTVAVRPQCVGHAARCWGRRAPATNRRGNQWMQNYCYYDY